MNFQVTKSQYFPAARLDIRVDLPPKRKRKSRWANDELDKTFIPGMPTVLPADSTEEQKQQYLFQLQIEESTRKLRSGDLGISAKPEERSPSPEPIYNSEGKRMNTREYRTRKRLEEERHDSITKLLELNPNYKPPADYKPPIIRVNDKVMIPQDMHPEINFVGLLIGPRGNTLKNLEKDTGAKIIIRGKGSVKEGKIGRKDGQPMPGEDEPLHAYITANDPLAVQKAVNKIHEIIKEGIEVPEEKNDLRKQQLRELALLNGTLRDNDGLQKLRQIAEAQTIVTNTIICVKCGGAGHIAKDCTFKSPAELAMVASQKDDFGVTAARGMRHERAKMDSEYMSLMEELGQVAPGTVRDGLAAQMSRPTPLMAHDVQKSQSRFDRKEQPSGALTGANALPVGQSPNSEPHVSSDYGYGGKRSRFSQEFSSPPNQRDRGGRFDNQGPSRFDQSSGSSRFERNDGPSRFDQNQGSSRNDQSPGPSRFNQNRDRFEPNRERFEQNQSRFEQKQERSRFDQDRPARFDQNANRPDQNRAGSSRFEQGGPPRQQSRFDSGPPGPPGTSNQPQLFQNERSGFTNNSGGPQPPQSQNFQPGPPPPPPSQSGWGGPPQQSSQNRWQGTPSSPQNQQSGFQGQHGGFSPQPGPPGQSSNHSHPWQQQQPQHATPPAPWQSNNGAPPPPWQSGFGGSMPPPPPPSSGGYQPPAPGYSQPPLPPPPPPS